MKRLKLRNYLKARDMLILTEVYAEFVNDFRNMGVEDEDFSSRLDDVFKRARKLCNDAEPDFRRETINKTYV